MLADTAMGCSVDQRDGEAIQLPCGKIEYTESFEYLGVELWRRDICRISRQRLKTHLLPNPFFRLFSGLDWTSPNLSLFDYG